MEPSALRASGASSGARVALEGLVLTGLVMARWFLKDPCWVLYTDMTAQLVPRSKARVHTRFHELQSLWGHFIPSLNSFLSVLVADNLQVTWSGEGVATQRRTNIYFMTAGNSGTLCSLRWDYKYIWDRKLSIKDVGRRGQSWSLVAMWCEDFRYRRKGHFATAGRVFAAKRKVTCPSLALHLGLRWKCAPKFIKCR